jgi:hypothetical protein
MGVAVFEKIVKTLKKDKKFDCVGYLTKKAERIVEEELTSLFEYLTKKLKDPKFKQYFEDFCRYMVLKNRLKDPTFEEYYEDHKREVKVFEEDNYLVEIAMYCGTTIKEIDERIKNLFITLKNEIRDVDIINKSLKLPKYEIESVIKEYVKIKIEEYRKKIL